MKTGSTKRKQLEDQLVKMQAKLEQAMKEQGEACGESCDWHDNNAYDLAVGLTDTYQSMVDSLKNQLKDLAKSERTK
jgi:hypothetical protein